MIDTDLLQFLRCNALAWLEQIYLQAHFNLLGECALRKDRLHLRHNRAGHHAAFRSDGVDLLPDARHDRKVLRKIVRDETTDSTAQQIVRLAVFCQSVF